MEKTRKMTLDEFKATKPPHGTDAILNRFNGGRFMECHTLVFAKTGIWIEELVPVFQKLDAMITIHELPQH